MISFYSLEQDKHVQVCLQVQQETITAASARLSRKFGPWDKDR